MGAHLVAGEFQSDKYPTCPRGKVPLSTKDPMAQDLLWIYAQRRRAVDEEFADDLGEALRTNGLAKETTIAIGSCQQTFTPSQIRASLDASAQLRAAGLTLYWMSVIAKSDIPGGTVKPR